MITPAHRTTLVNEYYFSQKLKQIDIMNQSGETVINLGIGNPDQMPPEDAIEVIKSKVAEPNTNGYQSYIGIPELRKAFSSWYQKYYNVQIDVNTEILPLIGSKEGIMHISMAYLNPGDKVLVPNPGYPTYTSVSKIVGAEIVLYNLKPENGWFPDFEELENLIDDKVKIMWVNYPNMPTGQNATAELYQKLVDFGIKHQILICNDNPYSFILNDNPISIMAANGAKEVCLELNSLSKSHNMAGFRIGMVTGKAEFISTILKIKSNMDSGMYKPLQLGAAKALESQDDWYVSINVAYKNRRELAYNLFDMLGAEYDKSQVGMFLWAKIPETYANAIAFSDYFLEKARVFITPGAIFGSNGDQFARISLCSKEEVLQQAIERIAKVLNK